MLGTTTETSTVTSNQGWFADVTSSGTSTSSAAAAVQPSSSCFRSNNNNKTMTGSTATPSLSVTPTLLPSSRQQQQDRMSPCPTPSRLTPNQKSPSPISDSMMVVSNPGRRTRSPFFDHFRRRSKSDSKSSSSADFTSHSKGHQRRGSGILSALQKHIPWTDRRSCSVDVPSESGGNNSHTSSNTASTRDVSSATDRHRTLNPALSSHLSTYKHHLDPYYTYTYGQDPRSIHSKRNRSGSGSSSITRVMDIFKRQDSSSNHGSSTNVSAHQGSNIKRSFDFGDLGMFYHGISWKYLLENGF